MEFRLPDLGENVAEGEVVQVLVREGDMVEKDQPVIELETDKALLEVPSPARGRIARIQTAPGKKLRVNDVILVIEESGAAASAPRKDAPVTAVTPAAPANPEPPKVAAIASAAAKPAPSLAPPTVQVKAEESVDDEAESARVVEIEGASGKRFPAAPSTRRLARELGVDLAMVEPVDPSGRITKEDVLAHVKSRVSRPSATPAPLAIPGTPLEVPPLPDFSQWGPIERKPLTNIRKRTMERMAVSWATIPHVTQIDEADITDLMALRERHAARVAEKGGKLTVTVFVLKAVISALKAYPQFNASLDTASSELILKGYYNLGVAVDTEHGLMVPVIKDADKKDVMDLSTELLTLSDHARHRKIKIEELRGATFTITNLGGIGGTSFSPIINHPEVAILGLAKSQKRLVMSKNGIETRLILPLCLSYDHRVIDGADGIRFTRKIAEMLEDPALLLLEA